MLPDPMGLPKQQIPDYQDYQHDHGCDCRGGEEWKTDIGVVQFLTHHDNLLLLLPTRLNPSFPIRIHRKTIPQILPPPPP